MKLKDSDKKIEDVLMVGLCTPLGNPADQNCPMGLPMHFQGPPGIAKSAITAQISKQLGLPFSPLMVQTTTDDDVSGMPVPDGQGGLRKVCFILPIVEIYQKGRGVLLIDELTGGSEDTQAALLGLFLDRRIGDIRLPGSIRVIAASNPPDIAVRGVPLAAPTVNRLVNFEVTSVTEEDWANALMRDFRPLEDIDLSKLEAQVTNRWPATWARSRSIFATYMRKRMGTNVLHRMPPTGKLDKEPAWPSSRTWELAARAVATCFALDQEDLIHTFVAACVGPGAAKEWVTAFTLSDLPDPSVILQTGDWEPNPSRPDQAMSTLEACASYLEYRKNDKDIIPQAAQCWKFLQVATDNGLGDAAVHSAGILSRAQLSITRPELRQVAGGVINTLRAGKFDVLAFGGT